MESNSELKTCMQTCLTCGCSDLDPSGDHARFCGGNGFATRLHTVLKWLVASMVKVVAADPSSGVSEVVVEQDGAVRGRLRPGEVAFSELKMLACKAQQFGIVGADGAQEGAIPGHARTLD